MDSVNQPDITTQRDYIYDERTHYPKGHPAKPFIQCGMEPISIIGAAVNEMLLQSNEGKIRIFPAVPAGWATAFSLRTRGAFLVSSELREDGSVPGILINSLKGNDCRVVNPWGNRSIGVWNIDGEKKQIKNRIVEDNIIVFKTVPDATYLIVPQGQEIQNKSVYVGTQNNAPKYFLEAILGKERNF